MSFLELTPFVEPPRRKARVALDDYPTPSWCVRRLIEAAPRLRDVVTYSNSLLPHPRLLEPTAGSGGIIKAARAAGCSAEWCAVELDIRHEAALCELDDVDAFVGEDFLQWEADRLDSLADTPFDLALGNPPYSIALDIVQACMRVSREVCMLLRVGFLESSERNAWVRQHTPDLYVLPNRPAFQHGKTDSCVYAWHWFRAAPRSEGRVVVLADTPIAERKLG